ncbi:MAG: xanthine dehydrogenase family protein molybdopterin-binding subunit [Acidobacteriota bacterium]|nr:xanthine dehydrogenase family protein molybdopterin-binding subunit [Acidobacteriota bacterium]
MKLDDILITQKWVGTHTPRKEDVQHLRGEATFVDDLDMECYQAAVLGSPYAHATIKKIDVSRASQLKGVLAVLTGEEVARETQPIVPRAITESVTQYVMAVDKVRYVGEPLAVVVAVNEYIAEDALDLIHVEFEPLSPVVKIADALKKDAPLIFEEAGSNTLLHDVMEHGDLADAHKDADRIVKETFRIQRYSSTPLEPWGMIVKYEKATSSFVVWANDQQHGRSIVNICHTLGISADRLRFHVPDSGGSFGIKLALWPYIAMMALLAKKVDRPVKWIQTRTQHLMAGSHTPDAEIELELALKKDGKILGLSIKDTQNDGSFIHTAGIYALIKFANMVGCYTIPTVRAELKTVVTNQGPTVQNRGVGKPAMIFSLERMINLAAKELGLDPIEMRFKNFVQPDQMPYTTPSGEIYESGDYPRCLQKALDIVEYEKVKQNQERMRHEGRYMGIGISCGVEPGTSNLGYYYTSSGTPEYTGNAEGAMAAIDFDGNANVLLGSVDSGQGHNTTAAQVVADMLAISPDRVSVNSQVDSLVSPFLGHSGVYSNKFNDVDLGAVIMATKKVRDKMLRIAAHVLECEEGQLELSNGVIQILGHPDKNVSFKEIATLAYKRILMLPEGLEPGLKEIAYYKSPYAKLPSREDFNVQLTHSNSVHAVVVEVDVETGTVTFPRYIIVHDCGKQINPGVVEGMLIGSTVHGIGAALYEEFLYDDDGQLLSSTFINYLKPNTVGIPRFETTSQESPCPYTLLGSKSAGEGGSITSLAAIGNAVEDALSPFGVKVTGLPITPEKVLAAIHGSKEIR